MRKGAVLRLLGDLDPVGQQARILVEIEDPLGLEKPESERGVPLLLGSFVHVKIEARKLAKVIEIPRKAVHAGRYVHLFTEGGLLEIKSVRLRGNLCRSTEMPVKNSKTCVMMHNIK